MITSREANPNETEPSEIPERVSIVNANHPDPQGSGYFPPTEGKPYWRDPEGNRVTVREVWGGADDPTTRWIFELTLKYAMQTYADHFHEQRAQGRIFRGAPGVSSLLCELQSQLGEGHWLTK